MQCTNTLALYSAWIFSEFELDVVCVFHSTLGCLCVCNNNIINTIRIVSKSTNICSSHSLSPLTRNTYIAIDYNILERAKRNKSYAWYFFALACGGAADVDVAVCYFNISSERNEGSFLLLQIANVCCLAFSYKNKMRSKRYSPMSFACCFRSLNFTH